jgi:hypothetical protein
LIETSLFIISLQIFSQAAKLRQLLLTPPLESLSFDQRFEFGGEEYSDDEDEEEHLPVTSMSIICTQF